jgi:hypothetical protein
MSVSLDAMDQTSHVEGATIQSAHVHPLRPSLLDPSLPSEPALGPCVCMPNVVVLYVLNHPIAIIHATAMDQVALERWLTRVRSREPRVEMLH